MPYIEASISAGSDLRILVKHILSNCIPTIVVYSMLEMAFIMSISTLFLGIGQRLHTGVGALISAEGLYQVFHIFRFSVIFIFITVTGFNSRRWPRDVLDPRM